MSSTATAYSDFEATDEKKYDKPAQKLPMESDLGSLKSELLKLMKNESQHKHLVSELLQAEARLATFEHKAEEKTSGQVADVGSVRTEQKDQTALPTLMQQAAIDHQELTNFMRGAIVCRTSRQTIVDLLGTALEEAKKLGHDNDLLAAYRHIQKVVHDWYFDQPFLRIVNTTLNRIERQELAREQTEVSRLATENVRLRAHNEQLQQSNRLLKQVYTIQKKVADDKSIMIQERNTMIVKLISKYAQAEASMSGLHQKYEKAAQRLEQAAERIDSLLEENADLSARLDQQAQFQGSGSGARPKSTSHPSKPKYDPRLLGGGGSGFAEAKGTRKSSPQKPRERLLH